MPKILSMTRRVLSLPLFSLVLAGCSPEPSRQAAEPDSSLEPQTAAEAVAVDLSSPTPEQRLTPVLGARLQASRHDLQGVKDAGVLRVLVGYSHTHYFMDGLRLRGISAENLRQFEPVLQKGLGDPRPRINVLPLPVARDEMIDFLANGYGDMAIGNITATDERSEHVVFSVPIRRNVSEVIVHGAGVSDVETLDDLAGRTVHVRASSSFFESLVFLNVALTSKGLAPLNVQPLDEHLQTEDILELVNAGTIGITVADDHMAEFWGGVLDGIVVRSDLPVRTGRDIAWALRRELADLKPIVDEFVRGHREGTLVGNVLFQRYLRDNRYVQNASASADRKRFEEMTDVFRRYSSEYDFDWLLIAAQGYQESQLIQSRRSPAGAIGVMQLLPATAKSPPVGIPNIEELEANIHAGHKYLRHIADRYFADEDMSELDRHLFSFAAYNAGPTRISRLRREAAELGIDPNVWFGQMERLIARKVGMEPVTYVRNIFKYYVTYKLMQEEAALEERLAAGAS
ncbi:MAG: transporter substrate-binding domain-containing protein [Gammaproteobacteria bacterium]|nr:MAG: transporter substrate-binding domain-containing protein [Gammaproteobacteria bacterium]